MNCLLTKRIVELTFTPLAELPTQLERLGLQCQLEEHGESLWIDNGHQRVGFSECVPITKAVQLGFALAGPFWASAMPTLLEEVSREWKLRRKAAR